MKKTLVYGRGKFFAENRDKLPDDVKIVAWGNSNPERATSKCGILVEGMEMLSPDEIKAREGEFDLILIGTDYSNSIEICTALNKAGASPDKIRCLWSRVLSPSIRGGLTIADGDVVFYTGDVKIKLRTKTDEWCCREIFLERDYGIDIPHPRSIVVDIGMNVGTTSLFFASNPNVEKVYGYEPFPDTYQCALENLALNEKATAGKIIPHNFAVSCFDGSREIPVCTELLGCRTTEPELLKDISGKRTERIEYRRADSVISGILEENRGKPLILKIDTEGSEFEIFDCLKDTDILSHVDSIAMEYHNKTPEALLGVLETFGFRYVWTGTDRIGMIYAFNTAPKEYH